MSTTTIPFVLCGRCMPDMEHLWSNEIEGATATGPYFSTPKKGDEDQVWGIVLIAPASSGFYAGWSNGEKATSAYLDVLYSTPVDAANAAEELARLEAVRQCSEPL